MLASIIRPYGDIPDRDFLVFLTQEEITKLKISSLKGEIFEFRDVRKVFPLEILLNADRSIPCEIEVLPDGSKYIFNINNYFYKMVEEAGFYGTRPDTFSKIDVVLEQSAVEGEFLEYFKSIKSRWENRDKIAEKMNRG